MTGLRSLPLAAFLALGLPTRSLLAASALLLAALGCRDEAESPMEPTATTPQATVSAATVLAFWQISAGFEHTCGVTTDKYAYCWGWNLHGQLGDGTTADRLRPSLSPVASSSEPSAQALSATPAASPRTSGPTAGVTMTTVSSAMARPPLERGPLQSPEHSSFVKLRRAIVTPAD